MEEVSIFYSWQSDHRQTNNFIDKALSKAIDEVADIGELNVSPRLDKDTQGMTGSPSIVNTIKEKIDSCGIFVVDISIVGESTAGKKLVNQNVMFETGYAIARHTEANTIMLFNSDLGDPKDLPFDISHHRVLQFSISQDKDGSKLTQKLVGAIGAHLNSLSQQKIVEAESQLDEIELLIMKLLASMKEDKRIMVSMTMGGPSLIPVDQVDEAIYKQLGELDQQEVVANLDSLVGSGVLTLYHGSRGTPNYKPTKYGYEMIKILNGNGG